jgi:FkbM family methyltransferase
VSPLTNLKRRVVARSIDTTLASDKATWRLLARLTSVAAWDGTPRYLRPTADNGVSPSIYQTGAFDRTAFTWALNALGNPHRGGLFVDVGANIGTTTIPALTDGAVSAIAFEPVRANYALLVANAILNGLEDRLDARHAAVSGSSGTVNMELSPVNQGDHRVRTQPPTAGAFDETAWTTEPVRAVTLDDELAGHTLGLLWIDTQGHEPHVLDGAQAVIATGVPVVAEFYPYALARSGVIDHYIDQIGSFGRVIDVRASIAMGSDVPVSDPRRLIGTYRGPRDYTDLLLLR